MFEGDLDDGAARAAESAHCFCGLDHTPDGHFANPQSIVFPSSGSASNGKTIYDWDQAAAQLTRSGASWSPTNGTPAVVTYAFRGVEPANMPGSIGGFQSFNAQQILAAEAALQLWGDVANITFQRVGSGTSAPGAYSGTAAILFGGYLTEDDPAAAFAYLPVNGQQAANAFDGDIWVDNSESDNANPVFGEYGPHVLVHEIGHAIGISHPGDYDGGSPTYAADALYWQDARMFTVMSYFGSTNTGGNLPAFAYGPQLHDIAAAQLLYGANMNTRTGDTVYGFNSNADRTYFQITSASQGVVFSVWDAGGVDTLDFSGYGENADIDLRQESFTSAGPTSDRGPALYNISIARGATIENAIGGSGSDTLTGNDSANRLEGRNGSDTLNGGLGSDTLVGGGSADSLDGGAGVDTASFADASGGVLVRLFNGTAFNDIASGDSLTGIENVVGSSFGDELQGDNANANLLDGGDGDDSLNGLNGVDTLIGGNGADTLNGDADADLLDGGADIDTATYDNALFGVVVRLFNGSARNSIADGDTLVGIENAVGSMQGDELLGSNTGDNVLSGLDGGDTIDGLAGDDTLLGGAGSDTLTGDVGADMIDGGADIDTANYAGASGGVLIRLFNGTAFNSAASGDTLISIENVVGTSFADEILGDNATANRLEGGNGADTLNGLNGVDTLLGGDGDDLLNGDADADLLDGGTGIDTATYDNAIHGVIVRLFNGTARNSIADGDTLTGVENARGSANGDELYGSNSNNNALYGLAGADIVNGLAGNDTLSGGDGNDTLTGEAGNDTFVFDLSVAANADRITDFVAGAGVADVVSLIGFGAAFDSFAEVLAAATDDGLGNVVIDFGGGNSLRLDNVLAANLNADDFIFG